MIACGKIGARSADPIGFSVCGFRYGAGGAGMSGRMLYQRSGMSLSLSRIFLVTAPSLLNPCGRRLVRSVALDGAPWVPASVAPRRGAFAEQFQPGAGTVGAARRRP